MELPDLAGMCHWSWCDLAMKHGIPSLAVFLSLLISIAPLPSVMRMNRPGGPLVGNPLPFPSLHNLALSWCLYAFLIKDVYLFLSNVLGLVISQFYIASSFTASFPSRVHRSILTIWLFGTLGIIIGFGAAFYFAPFDEAAEPMPPFSISESQHTSNRARTIAGIVCDSALIIFYLSPLMMVVDVIKRRRSDSISMPISFFALLNSLLWSGYGLVLRDWWVIAPNLLGVGLALFQLFLGCIFPRSSPSDKLIINGQVVPTEEEVVITPPMAPVDSRTDIDTVRGSLDRRMSLSETSDASRPLLFTPRVIGDSYGTLGRVPITHHFVPQTHDLPPRYPHAQTQARQRHHSTPGNPLAHILSNDLGFFGFSTPRQPLPQPVSFTPDGHGGVYAHYGPGLIPNPYYNTHEGPVVFNLQQ
jgi:hypothetical protein